MEAPWEEWEGAAGELLEATCTSAPVDAFALATACGYEVRAGDTPEACLRGRVIHLNPKMRPQRQHGRIAHELGHVALRRSGLEDSEDGARWAAGALMLPRYDFGRDLTQTAWSLPKLRALHVHASAEMIAIRTVQLRDAVATVFDGRRLTRRLWSPWVEHPALHRRRRTRLRAGASARRSARCGGAAPPE